MENCNTVRNQLINVFISLFDVCIYHSITKNYYCIALYPGEVADQKFATERFRAERKPVYQNGGISGEIYIKLLLKPEYSDLVLLCGQHAESLKHTSIKIDLYAAEDNIVTNDYLKHYSFDHRRKDAPPLIEWPHRMYVSHECTELSQIPPGKHILGIERNESLKKGHVSSLIHVIFWEP